MDNNKLEGLARTFAINAHAGQKYGEFEYAVHLQAAVSVGIRFGISDPVIFAALWTHDTLEDTKAEYEELDAFLGSEVATIVAALTEPKGGNRKW